MKITIYKDIKFLKIIFDAFLLRRVWWFTSLARTEARFSRTTLGSFWLGISNLLSITLLSLVYGTVFKIENFQEYVIYLGLGLSLWNSLSSSISSAPNLLIQNEIKIKNTNINIIFYPCEEWAFQIQNFLQSFILVFFVLIFFEKAIIFNFIFYSILPLLNFLIFSFWFPLIISILGVRFRDLYQLIPIILQLTFLLSPILYIKENLGELIWIVNLNPIYLIISNLRDSIIEGKISFINVSLILILNLIGLIIAVVFLEKEKSKIPFLL